MRRLLCACLCTLLLTGCDLNIEDAAEQADNAIRNAGHLNKDTANQLNEIVDNFEEEFGKVGDPYE